MWRLINKCFLALLSRKNTVIQLSSLNKRQASAVSRVEVVCIAKNEDPYIEEWVAYNLKLGFDHVTVYDNGQTLEWLPSRFPDYVTVVPWAGAASQVTAYNDFLARHGDVDLWAAFIDVDEFIVLKRHPDIKSLINECSAGHGGALAINWVFYGSSGHLEQTSQPVTQRFTHRGVGIDPHVKCIVYIPHVASMGIHCPALKALATSNTTATDESSVGRSTRQEIRTSLGLTTTSQSPWLSSGRRCCEEGRTRSPRGASRNLPVPIRTTSKTLARWIF
jgi:hypothetical protein